MQKNAENGPGACAQRSALLDKKYSILFGDALRRN
jgi:hypothetical protein